MEKSEVEKTFSRTTLETIANGAVREQFADALLKVLANVDDINTEPKQKRKITIEIEFQPDGSRQSMETSVRVKTKLAPIRNVESVIFVVRDPHGEVFAVNNNVHQPELFKS